MSSEILGDSASLSTTDALCRYVEGSDYQEIPSHVTEAAKAYVLDSVACMVGGAQLTPSRMVIDFFAELGGVEEATVLGIGKRLPAPHAAYVNSYLNNALDFDDTSSKPASGHPGAAIIPAALAIAEQVGASGRDLLHAVILGYEVSLRIGAGIKPSARRYKQVWGLSTWQIFGAITAVAKLLRLDAEQVRHAFGLGGLNAPIPYIRKFGHDISERPYSWAKNNYGWASMGAVIAGLMAKRGFLGNRCILDGEHGFWVMAGSDSCDFSAITAGLGDEYLIVRTGFKPYACCRLAHTTLDAVRSILAKRVLRPAEIACVDVYTFSELTENLAGPDPVNIIDAQFHVPYLVTLELLGRSSTQGLAERDLTDPDVRTLLGRVRLHMDPEADRRFFEEGLSPSRVLITLQDRSRLEGYVEVPTGSPDGRPFTTADLEAKFRALVDPIVGSEQAMRLRTIIMQLDEYPTADLVARAVP